MANVSPYISSVIAALRKRGWNDQDAEKLLGVPKGTAAAADSGKAKKARKKEAAGKNRV